MISRIVRNQFRDLEVVMAATNEEAMNLASVEGPFGFYALDTEAKGYEPDKLGKDLLDFTGNRPIIFLGHEAFITDRVSQELYSANEYNDRLLKPFDREDFQDELLSKINNALVFAKREEFEQSIEDIDPDDFIQMKIKSFYLYNSFPHDIYMEITSTKYIKILSANKPFTATTLANYAKKNVRHLHIRKDDQLEYLETESKKCLKGMRKISPKSPDMILVLLRSITLAHQTLLAIGVTPSVLALCNGAINSILAISEPRKDLSEILERYPKLYTGIASKSLLTALIASNMCSKMGWESSLTKRKLVMAAILMDFTIQEEEMCKINSPSDPILKNFREEQINNYLQHPVRAAEVAQQFTLFPDIDFLIENHHETPNRKGFPNQPSHTKLTPLCSVLNVAQFIAAELDGEDINNQILGRTFRALSRDYNSGNFKDALRASRETVKLS